jgi:hypothetical protein
MFGRRFIPIGAARQEHSALEQVDITNLIVVAIAVAAAGSGLPVDR